MADVRFIAPRYIWQKLLILVFFLITLTGSLPRNGWRDNDAINLYFSKEFTAFHVPQELMSYRAPLRRPSCYTDISCTNKLIKILQIVQYTYFVSLMISLSGDVATNPGCKIGHLNVRSLLHENPLDVLCLHETWLNCSWRDAELAIEGYSLVRNDRKDERRGGGTAIW